MSRHTERTAQHTPGPYYVTAIGRRNGQRAIVGDASVTDGVENYTINSASLATVYRPADARLIAAAPDLLDAATLTLAHLMSKARRDPAEREVVLTLRSAIAKATGEQS